MRRRWLMLLFVPIACAPFGVTRTTDDAGTAPTPQAEAEAGEGGRDASDVPAGPCFLCDDFGRTDIDGGSVLWTQRRMGDVALEIEPGGGHLVARLGKGADQHAYLLRDDLVPRGVTRLQIDLEYDLVSMGDFNEAGDINLLVVTLEGNKEAVFFNLFDNESVGHARVSIKCDGCETLHTKTPAGEALGVHQLSVALPVGPGPNGSITIDGDVLPLLGLAIPPLPDGSHIQVRLGADQESKQSAPMEIHYRKIAIRFDPP